MPTACEEPSDPDCSRSQPDRENAALVLLASHRSDAFVNAIDTLLDDPKLVLDSPDLELDSSGRVVVVVAGADAKGSVVEHGAFTVSTAEPEDPGEQAIAFATEACLPAAAKQVVDARPSDVIRALEPAAALGRRWGHDVAVAAFGFGTSSSDALEVASADLGSPESREAVLDQLRGHGVVPRLDSSVAVRFVAPGEDNQSSIAAVGIARFAAELCGLTDASPCGPVRTLAVPKASG